MTPVAYVVANSGAMPAACRGFDLRSNCICATQLRFGAQRTKPKSSRAQGVGRFAVSLVAALRVRASSMNPS